MEEKYQNLKLAERGAQVSIIAYIILSLFKLGVGYFSSSEALTADGLNNATDIISSIAVLIGLKIASKPADDDHLYGHFRAETIASLIASLIMIGVGLNVLYNAVRAIVLEKEVEAPDLVSAVVGFICAALIFCVYLYNKKIASQINSSGLMAAAKDNLSDAWVSIGTSVGIIASQFGLPWIDPLAAVIVGVLIVKTGWDIFRESSYNLTDGFNKEKLEDITDSITKVLGVQKVKTIRARVHGNNILLDITVIVCADLTVVEAHNITEEIEKKLGTEFDISEAVIHVEPEV